jgi:flavin-dependent dehydrogenase
MSERYDVVIVGGGPGGSSLAGLCAQNGRRVVVLEQDRHPRFHIGESLLPMSCEVFDKLGLRERLDERFLKKYGAKFFCSDTGRENDYLFSEAFDHRYEHAYQVPRAEFDQLLFLRAAELGAEMREGWRVSEVLFEGDRAVGVKARPVLEAVAHGVGDGTVREASERALGEVQELRAPLIVDATGRGSLLASRFSQKKRLPQLDQTALFAHYKGVPRDPGLREGHIWIIVYKHGWFWVIPFKNGVTSVGTVMSREWASQRKPGEPLNDFMDRTIAESSVAKERLAKAERLVDVRTTADFSYAVGRVAGLGWLCVGDACGFIDPLFSTGAHLAIKGADVAAETIETLFAKPDAASETLARYERVVKSAAGMFLGVVQAFYGGTFRELLFEQPQRRTIRQIITSMLSGDVFHPDRMPQWAPFVRERYPAMLPA